MKENMRSLTKGLPGLNILKTNTYKDTCKAYSLVWLIVMLLAVLTVGCNGNTKLGGGGGGTTGPTVNSTSPANNATGVAIDTTVTATFSTAMDSATINTSTFTLTTGSTSVAGTVDLSADGLTATFTPDADLTPDTLYTATITTGAKDVNGNALTADEVWTFTTGTGSAPKVLSTNPADGATNVATTTLVTATFSTAMDPLTINDSTFTLTTGTTNVLGTVSLSADGLTATFTPTGGVIAASSLFVARITSLAKDVNGNAVVPKTWSFTTGVI